MMSKRRSFSSVSHLWRYVGLLAALLIVLGCAGGQSAKVSDKSQAQAKAAAVEVKAPVTVPRETAEGVVIGLEDAITQANSWKAIPYAKPPVGALRWRAPEPAEKRS